MNYDKVFLKIMFRIYLAFTCCFSFVSGIELQLNAEQDVVVSEKDENTKEENHDVSDFASGNIAINEVNFPDVVWKQIVTDTYDINRDGMLQVSELVKITEVFVSNRGISSLKGIEYFTQLTSLDCSYNKISNLDLYHNSRLKNFKGDNQNITVEIANPSGNVWISKEGIFPKPDPISRSDTTFADDEYDCGTQGELRVLFPAGNSSTFSSPTSNNNFKVKGKVYITKKMTVINEENFPDEIWRNWVKDNYDTNNDGYLTDHETDAVTSIDISNKGIANIKGMEYFTELRYLDCSSNEIIGVSYEEVDHITTFIADNQQVKINVRSLDENENWMSLKTLDFKNSYPTLIDAPQDCYIQLDHARYLYVKGNHIKNLKFSSTDGKKVSGTIHVIQNIAIDELNFPDEMWRKWVKENADTNGDGFLSGSEIEVVTSIDISDKYISDIKGMEHFINLNSLNCSFNKIFAISYDEVSQSTSLTSNNQRVYVTVEPDQEAGKWVSDVLNTKGTSISLSANAPEGCYLDNKLHINGNNVKSVEFVGNIGRNRNYGTIYVTKRIPINEKYFPDSNWRLWVEDVCDLDNDGYLSESEINAVVNIDVSYSRISNLTGIEYFYNLKNLDFSYNMLSDLNLSNSTKLTTLKCSNNRLSTLDISMNKALNTLYCDNNKLPYLNLSNQLELTSFSAKGQSISVKVGYDRVDDNWKSKESTFLDSTTFAESMYRSDGEGRLIVEDVSVIASAFQSPSIGQESQVVSGRVDINDGIWINETNFPDENFRTYVAENLDNGDDFLTVQERNAVTIIDVSYMDIYDLTGIEYFTKLGDLYCNYNKISELDVSQNSELAILWCNNNLLTELDVSANSMLNYLDCSHNRIEKLDITQNERISRLDCYGNCIPYIDFTNNDNIVRLEAMSQEVNVRVGYDRATGNWISKDAVFLSTTEIENQNWSVDRDGKLIITDISDSFASFQSWSNNRMVSGDVTIESGIWIDETNFPDDKWRAYVRDNYDTDHNGLLSNNESKIVKIIDVSSSGIANLTGIEYFTELANLNCSFNNLTTLNISKNIKLESLICSNNQLSTLDLSDNTKLSFLYCDNNKLPYLDLKNQIEFTSFSAYAQSINVQVGYDRVSGKWQSLKPLFTRNTSFSENAYRVNAEGYLIISDKSILQSSFISSSVGKEHHKVYGSVQIELQDTLVANRAIFTQNEIKDASINNAQDILSLRMAKVLPEELQDDINVEVNTEDFMDICSNLVGEYNITYVFKDQRIKTVLKIVKDDVVISDDRSQMMSAKDIMLGLSSVKEVTTNSLLIKIEPMFLELGNDEVSDMRAFEIDAEDLNKITSLKSEAEVFINVRHIESGLSKQIKVDVVDDSVSSLIEIPKDMKMKKSEIEGVEAQARGEISIVAEKESIIDKAIIIYSEPSFLLTAKENKKDKLKVDVYKGNEEKYEGTDPLMVLQKDSMKSDIFILKAMKYEPLKSKLYEGIMTFTIRYGSEG